MKKKVVKIYTDGGCNPNPGPGKWAWAINEKENGVGSESDTTNNRMELQAVLEAIKYAKDNYSDCDIVIYSDSKYCVNGFNSWMHGWQKRKWKKKDGKTAVNVDLWKLLFSYKDLATLKWVRGHDGDRMNEYVDSLCTMSKNPTVNHYASDDFKPTIAERELFDIIERHYPYVIAGTTRVGFYEKIHKAFDIQKK